MKNATNSVRGMNKLAIYRRAVRGTSFLCVFDKKYIISVFNCCGFGYN